MREVQIGSFHNVAGVQMGPYGISIYDRDDMEYFLEIVPASEDLKLDGEFGRPPEEGGFQHIEGIRLTGVTDARITHLHQIPGNEVRRLKLSVGPTTLRWNLYIPCN